MIDAADHLPTVEPELLVATWSAGGAPTFCNAAWRAVLGPQETPWLRLTGPDTDRAVDAVAQAANGHLVTNCVVQAHTPKRDEPLPLLLHVTPVYLPKKADGNSASKGEGSGGHKDGGRAVQAVSVVGEVMAEPDSWTTSQTQRHRLEALGRMTMGIAHDFNNLLSGLQGHIELLKEASPQASADPDLRASLDTIEQVADDGAALIRKLQDYIRNDQEAHFEPVDLADLVEDCIALTQPYWHNEPRRQGITIAVERDLRDVPPVMGAASELREVLVNLILNAVQAMPDGGTLTFKTHTNADRHACIVVADTGRGMAPEVQQQIFEPLYTTKGESGTGMGLAVSQGIVQEHGGTIDVTSTPQEGTRFTLAFPPADDHADASARGASPTTEFAAAEPEEPPPSAARVLVVDDEAMVRNIVNKLLSLRGHTVERFASGADALAAARAQRPDIVFTDYGMPAMDGVQLAHALQEAWPGLPVVLLTGEAEVDNFERHVDRVLEKPFKLRDLDGAIRDLVSRG